MTLPLNTILFTILITSIFCSVINSQYETHDCYNTYGNYSSEDLYRANLNSLLPSLFSPTNMGNTGFYAASEGQVHALALCRPDTQLSECRGCVRTSIEDVLRSCPNQRQATIWTQYCMVRYSNRTMLGIFDTSHHAWVLSNSANVTGEALAGFRRARAEVLAELRAEAADGGPLRKAAVGNRSVSSDDGLTFFAMVQCTPDLSSENCTACLVLAAGIVTGVNDSVRGNRVYMPSCIIRYEYEPQPFYNLTRFQESLAPMSPPPGNGGDNGSRRSVVIIVVPVVTLILVAFLVVVGIFVRKRLIKQKRVEFPDNVDEISTVESIQYDFDKIRAATNGFSDANKLGQGGFGAVYKGKLENGREIAVKRLSRDSGQGSIEFKNEVLLIAKLQHRNLVRILGFSIQEIERLLIYELVPNGSLDHFIYDPIRSSTLDWEQRNRITVGVAKGLLYLHEDSRLKIIHRDLKAGNVLLDEEMNPKISDFGLAKLVVPDETTESTNRIVGTYGYMAPEYAIQGHFSVKSDVYSFGVLVLEIVTGQRKVFLRNGKNFGDLLSYAWRSWNEKTSADIIDPVLKATCGTQPDMLRCIHIALLCVQENAVDRPTMASVVLMLNSYSLTLPMPSKPGFYVPGNRLSEPPVSHGYYNSTIQVETSKSSKGLLVESADISINDYSITEMNPR